MVRNASLTPLESSSSSTSPQACASLKSRTTDSLPPTRISTAQDDSSEMTTHQGCEQQREPEVSQQPIHSPSHGIPRPFTVEENPILEKSCGSRSTESTADITNSTLTPTSQDSGAYFIRQDEVPATTAINIPLPVTQNSTLLLLPQHHQQQTQPQQTPATPLFAGQSLLLKPAVNSTTTDGSMLSMRDMFQDNSDLMHQNEYFTYDDISLDNIIGETPPTSVRTTPTGLFSQTPPPSTDCTSTTLHQLAQAVKIQLPPPAAQILQPAGSSLVSKASISTSHASSQVMATSMASSCESSSTQQPVLYSAIGSLEDPSTNNSYGRYTKRPTSKFEFPSSRLLPPANQIKNNNGRSSKKDSNRETKTPKSRNIKGEVAKKEGKRVDHVAGIARDLVVQPSQLSAQAQKPSSLRSKTPSSVSDDSKASSSSSSNKKVTIDEGVGTKKARRSRKKKGPAELFRPSSDAYTPRMGKKQIKFKPAELRTPVQNMASDLGTISRPNFRDALRRVAMILRQHIVKIERRFESKTTRQDDGLFRESMRNEFSEDCYVTPTYKCTMVRVPMARPGMVYGLKKVRRTYEIPTEAEIYEFGHQLFNTVQLSSECSIVCLIYVERLMEVAKVPLLSNTWRPIFMCGLLLASKVWQDMGSWNIEFASVYPQYSLESINRLELQFLRKIQWELYISSSEYAKYYFALRSLVEKSGFRQRYNRMVGGVDRVQADEALKIEERSTMIKEKAINQLSRSM